MTNYILSYEYDQLLSHLSSLFSGQMSVNIPQLKKLTFLKDDTELLLLFEDLVTFLKENKVAGDKPVRPDNIKSYLLKKNEIRPLSGSTYVTFQGVLIYIINHKDEFSICKDTFDSITGVLTGKEATKTSTLLNLYEEVAKVKFTIDYVNWT